ncbi:Rieske 2Fe-2S domain-containing protein [Sphingobium scionense]
MFSSQEIYDREQERIFRGPVWNFLGLEAEIPNPHDFKRTFVGDTPVVMTRCADGSLAAWVNRCAHRGAEVCRANRGNAQTHDCVYHQWSYAPNGDLIGVPFRRGQKGACGMPADFKPANHGLQKLRVDSYRGLVFATFSEEAVPLPDFLGPIMRPYIDRLFHKPVVYLGCTRQYSSSNWKLYFENVKDAYHASLLHLFHTTFNIYRVSAKLVLKPDTDGLSSVFFAAKGDENEAVDAYKAQNIRTFADGFRLEDDSVLGLIKEYDEVTTNHIQAIFPSLSSSRFTTRSARDSSCPRGRATSNWYFTSSATRTTRRSYARSASSRPIWSAPPATSPWKIPRRPSWSSAARPRRRTPFPCSTWGAAPKGTKARRYRST